MTPKYIVIHTAAFKGRNCDSEKISEWHKAKGWREIGYHFVILNDLHDSKQDGTVEKGRANDIQGAHVLGINDCSIGICCVGHGDYTDFTKAQYNSLYSLIPSLMQQYSIPLERVIGHREVNQLVDKGIVSTRYYTSKSCPGRKINMDFIREQLRCFLNESVNVAPKYAEDEVIRSAVTLLAGSKDRFPNAQNELLEFIYHPEVIEFIEKNPQSNDLKA